MIDSTLDLPAFGFIPRKDSLALESRHLGLRMAHESGSMMEFGRVVEESCDLDAVIAAARQAPRMKETTKDAEHDHPADCTIAVARDEAFCFYYQDNLDLLSRTGARLLFFSPLHDNLPEADALYIGGGYPELHLSELESSPCTCDLRKVAEHGMPMYAECGGLMYLSKEIQADKTYRMCGILPSDAEMTSRIQALGYVRGTGTSEIPFISSTLGITGHEFHYSRLDPDSDARYAIRLSRGKGIAAGNDGLVSQNTIGCYTHAYFTPEFSRKFIESAIRFSND